MHDYAKSCETSLFELLYHHLPSVCKHFTPILQVGLRCRPFAVRVQHGCAGCLLHGPGLVGGRQISDLACLSALPRRPAPPPSPQ